MVMQDLGPYARMAQRPEKYASHVITITSQTAVGSSTTLKQLQQKRPMTWRYLSGGDIMRAFAEQKRMTIEDFAAHNRAHPEEGWDKKCDDTIREFGRQNYTIIEGRLPHAFVPHAFHVELWCDLEVRASRRWEDLKKKPPEGIPPSFDRVCALIRQRDEDDRRRYDELYPGWAWQLHDYDLRLNTGILSPEEVCREIMQGHESWRDWYKKRGFLCEEILFQS